MADALDLGSSSEKSKGSSPFARTKIHTLKKPCKLRAAGSLQGFCLPFIFVLNGHDLAQISI